MGNNLRVLLVGSAAITAFMCGDRVDTVQPNYSTATYADSTAARRVAGHVVGTNANSIGQIPECMRLSPKEGVIFSDEIIYNGENYLVSVNCGPEYSKFFEMKIAPMGKDKGVRIFGDAGIDGELDWAAVSVPGSKYGKIVNISGQVKDSSAAEQAKKLQGSYSDVLSLLLKYYDRNVK